MIQWVKIEIDCSKAKSNQRKAVAPPVIIYTNV